MFIAINASNSTSKGLLQINNQKKKKWAERRSFQHYLHQQRKKKKKCLMLGKPCNELWFNNDQSLIMTMTFYAKIKIIVRIGLRNTVEKNV